MARSLIELKEFQKTLIERATKSELKLHKHLTELGYKFEFQFIANFYIVDFLINDKYVVELDSPRFHNAAYDRRRDQYLREEFGYEVLRLKSYRVFRDLQAVLNEIELFLAGQTIVRTRKPR